MDIASFKDIYRPGGVGSCLVFGYTGTASAVQPIPFHNAAPIGGRATGQFALYINYRITFDFANGFGVAHIVFGDANVGAPTDTDTPVLTTDGWQRVILLPTDTSFRIKGHAATAGTLWMYPSGR
jgi:hypothetical protein